MVGTNLERKVELVAVEGWKGQPVQGGGGGEENEGTTRKNIAHHFMREPKSSILNIKRRGERKRNCEEKHLMLIHAGAQVLILNIDAVVP